ncbi:CPBP family intramembrane metalloprotease [Halostagnicola sp. A-GB9-2]|uniref:CPBP family intramembrane glutamic endopeptidase n=1 Tax=Halostagnicola sp. A-GB9-2 TaxID=3048066 RepID=UPI0024C06FE8|nr:CPBP family intramembrane metalloprotease [Halostagnicola sp. A-GB9-2]MDJ1432875.1 CPBP family intramembrane metalloprotease [Halostagnicola sp. A-GB9-2]
MDSPQSDPPSDPEDSGSDPEDPGPGVSGPEEPPSRSRLIAIAGSVGYVIGAFIIAFAGSIALMMPLMIGLMVTDNLELVEYLFEGDGFVFLAAAESAMLGLGAVGLAALSVMRGWIPKSDFGLSIPTNRQFVVSLIAIAGLVALGMALSIISNTLGIPASEHSLIDENASATYFLALAVISILIIGPAEELLFRGVIQNYMRPAFGSAGAIVLTSVLFSSIHLPAYFTATFAEAVVSLGVVLALSLVLGWLYEKYENLYLVMWIHGGYNAVLFLFQAFL